MQTRTNTRMRALRQKYRRLQKRIQRLIETGEIRKFSRHKRQQLARRLARYRRQTIRLAGTAALVGTTAFALHAQPFVQQTGGDNPFNGIDAGANSTPQVVDVDSDGDLDLISGIFDGTLIYYQNDGNGNYIEQTGMDSPFGTIDVGFRSDPQLIDIDSDGDLDLLLGDSDGTFIYYQNDGNGNYIEQTGMNNPFEGLGMGNRTSPQIIDVDKDGHLDLISGEQLGKILYYKNDGSGNYSQQTGVANPFDAIDIGYFSAPQLIDVDKDGDLDLIIGEQFGTIIYYENDGNNTYTQRTGSDNPFDGIDVGFDSSPQLLDTDKDGDLDVICGELSGIIFYFENQKPVPILPTFCTKTGNDNPFNGVSVGYYATPKLVDFDGDGDIDFLCGDDSGSVVYYKNTGTATNPNYVEQTGANTPFGSINVGDNSSLCVADLDGDDDLDLLMGERTGNIFYFENTGTLASPSYTQQTGANNPFDALGDVGFQPLPFFVDLDDDGDFDLLMGRGSTNIFYYENTGNATTPTYVQRTGSDHPFDGVTFDISSPSPQMIDLDKDGDLDLVIGDTDSFAAKFYENIGLTSSPVYIEQTGSNSPFGFLNLNYTNSLSLADVDGDGDVDMIFGESYYGNILYYENVDFSVEASTENCTGGSAEVEITVNSTETTGIYNITGDFTGTIGSAGVMGGMATIVSGLNGGTYNVVIADSEGCQLPLEIVIAGDCAPKIQLSPKVFLQGAYSDSDMNAALGGTLLPTNEPYTALGYSFVGGGGDESTTMAVLNTIGSTAIVDWVIVELRDETMPSTIIESRAALLRADGMVVDTDGMSPINFNAATGDSYYVAVRHRNHLGAMTETAIGF